MLLAAFMTLLCTYNVGLYADLLIRGSMPAICVMSILMAKTVLSNRGWQRETLVIYMLVAAIPVVIAFVKGCQYAYATILSSCNFQAVSCHETSGR